MMASAVVPELRSISSPDLEVGKVPKDPEFCAVFLEAEIGPRGEEGRELFSFVAITPAAIKSQGSTRWGRGYLLLNRFSWEEVERSLEKLFLHCSRPTWKEVAAELNKEIPWEFDNYRNSE